nr:hypothetical protein [Paenibacillus ihuae]
MNLVRAGQKCEMSGKSPVEFGVIGQKYEMSGKSPVELGVIG